METFVIALHIFLAVVLILVVLIQSGKGAEISASFAGSSQTVFGSSGGANFFTRFTAVTAALFMGTSITLTLISSKSRKSVFEGAPAAETAPAPTTKKVPAPGGAKKPTAPVPAPKK